MNRNSAKDDGAEGGDSEIPRKAIRYLLADICSAEDDVRWCAIRTLGQAVAQLADKDIEAARTIMRRLMWSLNDESGGIGWGAPEAMAEIMAHHAGLAGEFAHILISFINPRGNYLGYPPLQRGVLWAIKRMAEVAPARMEEARPFLRALTKSPEAEIREMAVAALNALARA
ncbi:MAG: DVU0298 family protein [Planctomycetota bacterium]